MPLTQPPDKFKIRPKYARLGLTTSATTAWSQFVLDAAGGLGPPALAAKYGMTLHKVELVLRAKETQEQVAECAKRLNRIGDYARSRLLSHAPDLVDAQLEVALGRDLEIDDSGNVVMDPETGEAKTKWRYRVGDRMAAGRYCLDRILPTVALQQGADQVPAGTVNAIIATIGELARALPSAHTVRESPHIYEGEKALPRAIELGDGK